MGEEKQNRSGKRFRRIAFAALTAYAAWELLCCLAAWLIRDVFHGISFSVTKASAIGVIGGADGPTAVFVTAAPVSVWQVLLWGVLLAAGILGLYRLKQRK